MTLPRTWSRAGRRRGLGLGLRGALLAGIAVALACPAGGRAGEPPPEADGAVPVLVGHATSAAAGFTRREIEEIFLGLKRTWPDGRPIEPVLLEGGATHDAFVGEYLKRSPQQFRRYWRQMVFSGQGRMPRTFGRPEDLLAYVGQTDGAIGYAADSLITRLHLPQTVILRIVEEGKP